MKRAVFALMLAAAIVALAACAAPAKTALVTVMLDWVPNTNHAGLYVAQEKGYFKQAGLEVSIIQPGEVFAEQAVASGAADFGVSFQEQVTLARAANPPASLVSIAAIIQHNTSGFATLAQKGIDSAKGFEGLTYASFGTAFEEPTLRALMACAGGDFSRLKIANAGTTDPLALLASEQVDLAWIFYGWQGIQAQQQGIDLNVIMLEDHLDCIPDYYTPILVASEQTIRERPETVRAFMRAVSQGYQDAMLNPDDAADALLKAAPELDPDLVKASLEWLATRYQADAPRWGEQKLEVWETYSKWMAANGIIPQPIDANAAFTNDFLP